MTQPNILSQHPTFSTDMHHLYKIGGDEWRFAYATNGTVTFSAIADAHRKLTYDVGTLNRLNGAGLIEVYPYGLMPKHLRPNLSLTYDDIFLTGLSRGAKKRLDARHAMVRAYLDLKEKKIFKVDDDEIKAAMSDIRTAAEAYLIEEMPDPEQDAKFAAWKAGEGVKPRSKLRVEMPDEVSARTLRKWVAAYKKGGKKALLDCQNNRGNTNSYFTVDEMVLMAKTVDHEYLNLQRKPISVVFLDVKRAFEKENKLRAERREDELRTPSREAVRQFIKKMDKFRVMVARFGQQEAMKRMRPVKDGMEADRPLQIVSMDEMKIDLLTMLVKSGLLSMIAGDDDTKQLEQLISTMRWWLAMAIDYRTRCILGMVLTPNPKTSSALKCLQMVVSDKGQFVDQVGALTPWSMFGTPETLFVDNGSAFKSTVFTNACVDLGISKVQTIAGQPGMRGKMESCLNTMQQTLFPRLSGRTFGDVVTRANHPAEARACLSLEDLAYALVRWIVDIYHNTPHEGLGGRTPLQQWEADLADGNYPLLAAPSLRRKRLAFGIPVTRKVQKDGIRVMGIRYTSAQLAAWYLKKGAADVDVRWFDGNIGSIEVHLDGAWFEVPAVSDIFRNVDATTWAEVRRALRARDKDRQEWDEAVVLQAITDIEALNAERKLAYNVIDHGWDEKRFAAVEREAMTSFEMVEPRATLAETSDGYGRSIMPVMPLRVTPAEEAMRTANAAAPSQATWAFKK